MVKTYNKLVRDNIPEIIKEAGREPTYEYITDEKKFEAALRMKLVEEAQEVSSARDRKELIEELADIFEVCSELMALYKIPSQLVIDEAFYKAKDKGRFSKRIFLKEVKK